MTSQAATMHISSHTTSEDYLKLCMLSLPLQRSKRDQEVFEKIVKTYHELKLDELLDINSYKGLSNNEVQMQGLESKLLEVKLFIERLNTD